MATVIPVDFIFPHVLAPTAQWVAVIGPFNGWDPLVHLLKKTQKGDWRITVYLPPGRIVYCFSIDGVPRLDPCDKGRVLNGWGREYSVRYVKEIRVRSRCSWKSRLVF